MLYDHTLMYKNTVQQPASTSKYLCTNGVHIMKRRTENTVKNK